MLHDDGYLDEGKEDGGQRNAEEALAEGAHELHHDHQHRPDADDPRGGARGEDAGVARPGNPVDEAFLDKDERERQEEKIVELLRQRKAHVACTPKQRVPEVGKRGHVRARNDRLGNQVAIVRDDGDPQREQKSATEPAR